MSIQTPSRSPEMPRDPLGDMLRLLSGKTWDAFAQDLDRLSAPRRANLSAIAKVALERLGEAVSDDACLPARAVERLLHSGSCVDDAVATAYWGGILASSRTPPGRDDRGVRWLALLDRLTAYQIRTHHLFYATLRRLCLAVKGKRTFDFDAKRYRLATFIPAPGYARAMRLADDEMPGLGPLAVDVLSALGGENLLDGSNTGNEQYLKTFFKSAAIAGEGIIFAPSIQGIRFFLWAFGQGDRASGLFVDDVLDCRVEAAVGEVAGAGLVYDD